MNEHEKRFDPKKAHRLDDPERLRYMPRNEIIATLQLEEEMTVADIGAGTGFFAIPIASALGKGKVFAVDVSREMLDLLRAKLMDGSAPGNIVLIEGEAENTSLKRESCDLVLMANVWHEVPNQVTVLREVKRILRPEGRLAIVDWRPDAEQKYGPPLDHRIPRVVVERVLHENQWKLITAREIGPYSYLVMADRP